MRVSESPRIQDEFFIYASEYSNFIREVARGQETQLRTAYERALSPEERILLRSAIQSFVNDNVLNHETGLYGALLEGRLPLPNVNQGSIVRLLRRFLIEGFESFERKVPIIQSTGASHQVGDLEFEIVRPSAGNLSPECTQPPRNVVMLGQERSTGTLRVTVAACHMRAMTSLRIPSGMRIGLRLCTLMDLGNGSIINSHIRDRLTHPARDSFFSLPEDSGYVEENGAPWLGLDSDYDFDGNFGNYLEAALGRRGGSAQLLPPPMQIFNESMDRRFKMYLANAYGLRTNNEDESFSEAQIEGQRDFVNFFSDLCARIFHSLPLSYDPGSISEDEIMATLNEYMTEAGATPTTLDTILREHYFTRRATRPEDRCLLLQQPRF